MTAKICKNLSDRYHKVIQAAHWYISINKRTRKCCATSGDYWFAITREEAVRLILGKTG